MIARSYLSERDPTVKVALVLIASMALFLVIDPITPLLVLAGTVAAGLTLGRIGASSYARVLAPLALVALGFVWTNAAFARVSDPAAVAWSVGPLRLTLAGLLFGLAIGLRGLAIGALSVTLVLTTDPTQLMVSLMRNARLPFRLGYPLLAAYRFLPFFRDELEQIDLARRVRGRVAHSSPLGRLRERAGEVVPLIAIAVRRSARVAVAMDARGFAGPHRRTFYREARIRRSDLLFAGLSIAAGAALLALSATVGWLRIWDGRFAA